MYTIILRLNILMREIVMSIIREIRTIRKENEEHIKSYENF